MHLDLTKKHSGQMNFHAGEAAEAAVARDYVRRGYLVAHRRWRGSRGEIDVILRDGAAVIFVEVKKSKSFARAALRISPAQVRRIYMTGNEFLAQEPNGLLTDVRFDVALVNQVGEVEIIENALVDG